MCQHDFCRNFGLLHVRCWEQSRSVANNNIVNLPVKCSVRMALDSQKLFKTQTKIQKLFIIHRKIIMNTHTHKRVDVGWSYALNITPPQITTEVHRNFFCYNQTHLTQSFLCTHVSCVCMQCWHLAQNFVQPVARQTNSHR